MGNHKYRHLSHKYRHSSQFLSSFNGQKFNFLWLLLRLYLKKLVAVLTLDSSSYWQHSFGQLQVACKKNGMVLSSTTVKSAWPHAFAMLNLRSSHEISGINKCDTIDIVFNSQCLCTDRKKSESIKVRSLPASCCSWFVLKSLFLDSFNIDWIFFCL